MKKGMRLEMCSMSRLLQEKVGYETMIADFIKERSKLNKRIRELNKYLDGVMDAISSKALKSR